MLCSSDPKFLRCVGGAILCALWRKWAGRIKEYEFPPNVSVAKRCVVRILRDFPLRYGDRSVSCVVFLFEIGFGIIGC